MARPLKPINWELVEKRMEAGSNAKEIAGTLQIDINTFYDRFKLEYGKSFADFADRYYDCGNANLRLTQYVKALAGNTNMMILLGRERLKQGREEIKVSPYQGSIDTEHENMVLKAEIEFLKEELKELRKGLPNADQPQAE